LPARRQDIMRLDNTARMNLPGTAGGNWAWRIGGADVWQRLAPEAEALRALAETYGRLAPQPVRGSVTQHGGARRSSMASATCPSAQGTVRWPAVECKQPHLFSDKMAHVIQRSCLISHTQVASHSINSLCHSLHETLEICQA